MLGYYYQLVGSEWRTLTWFNTAAKNANDLKDQPNLATDDEDRMDLAFKWTMWVMFAIMLVETIRFLVYILMDFMGSRKTETGRLGGILGVRRSRISVGSDKSDAPGQRLPFAPFLVSTLGVLVHLSAGFDRSLLSFYILTALSVATMTAEVSKILSRTQTESVIHSYVWVGAIYFSLVQIMAYQEVGTAIGQQIAPNDEEKQIVKDNEFSFYNPTGFAIFILGVPVVINVVYYLFTTVKRWNDEKQVTNFLPILIYLAPAALIVWHYATTAIFLRETHGPNDKFVEHYKGRTNAYIYADFLSRVLFLVGLWFYNYLDGGRKRNLGPTDDGRMKEVLSSGVQNGACHNGTVRSRR